ncbi:hypothetical protein JZ751_013002 [Albula glossodonta]|uniref:Uncharacterized protein n=1 Tax=Albula glossodonta TaxID=121402 RepID=A0A8T2N410_9TELE|nr:hypothetical protein JZ751_013002 [Albula glossodonta]
MSFKHIQRNTFNRLYLRNGSPSRLRLLLAKLTPPRLFAQAQKELNPDSNVTDALTPPPPAMSSTPSPKLHPQP